MKIQKLSIEGFGKISNMELNLSEGLNVIYGKNEAGKTTLQTFIFGMLYGFLEPGNKYKIYEDAYEKYRPWQNDQKYGGELVFALSSGQRFRVTRDFNSETVTVIDEDTWQDLTKDFWVDRKIEPLFAVKLLGIEKTIFRDCVYIKQQNIDTIENPDALADRLRSIAATGTEELSVPTAVDKLDNALKTHIGFGKARALKDKPLDRCNARIKQLENERADVKTMHNQLTGSIDELDALAQQKSDFLTEQRQFQYILACVEAEKIETLLEHVRDYNQKIVYIEQELEILKEYQNFPSHSRDTLLIYQTKLSEINELKENLEVALRDNENVQHELQGQLQSLSGCEQIGERLEEIRSLESRHKFLIEEEVRDNTAQADIQIDFTMQCNRLNDDESRFNSMDYNQFTQMLQNESNLQQKQINLDFHQREITQSIEQLDNLNHRKQRQKKHARILIFSGVVAWIATAVLLAFSLASSVVLFSVGLLGGYFSVQKRKQVKTLESQIDKLSADTKNNKLEFERRQQELNNSKKVVEELLEKVGVSSADELKAEFEKLQKQRQKVNQLKERVEASKDKLLRTQDNLQNTETQLHILISLALDSEEGSIDNRLALFWGNYNRYESLLNKNNDAKGKGESLKSEDDDANCKADEIHAKIEKILEEAGVETPKEYSDGCEKHQQYQEGRAEVKNLINARDNLLDNQELDALQQQLKQHQTLIQNCINDHPDLNDIDFDTNAKATYQQESDQCSEKLNAVENEISAVEARIEILMAKSRPLFEIEEELEHVTLEKGNLLKQKEALMFAKENLEAVSQEFFATRFAPELREIVTPMLQTVAGKYSEIRFDEKLNLRVRIPEINMIKDVGSLSQGTLDQIYFLLKASVAQMFSKNGEPLPLLLDDPFVTCDDERLARIWNILGSLARETQILLFTCHHSQMLDVKKRFDSDANTVASDVGDFTLLSIDA